MASGPAVPKHVADILNVVRCFLSSSFSVAFISISPSPVTFEAFLTEGYLFQNSFVIPAVLIGGSAFIPRVITITSSIGHDHFFLN